MPNENTSSTSNTVNEPNVDRNQMYSPFFGLFNFLRRTPQVNQTGRDLSNRPGNGHHYRFFQSILTTLFDWKLQKEIKKAKNRTKRTRTTTRTTCFRSNWWTTKTPLFWMAAAGAFLPCCPSCWSSPKGPIRAAKDCPRRSSIESWNGPLSWTQMCPMPRPKSVLFAMRSWRTKRSLRSFPASIFSTPIASRLGCSRIKNVQYVKKR